MSTAWLLHDIAEAKGKHPLFTRQSPQVLKALREAAIMQSTESSNRIEGVTVAPDRLRPLVLGNTKPRDRSEPEVQGYRTALDEIHARHEQLPLTTGTLKRLHTLCQSASSDAGPFKRVDNEVIEEVIELGPGAAPVLRFRCVQAMDTPGAVDELCLLYRHALDQDNISPLIAIAGLVLDFLGIHPFRDGSGSLLQPRTPRRAIEGKFFRRGLRGLRGLSRKDHVETDARTSVWNVAGPEWTGLRLNPQSPPGALLELGVAAPNNSLPSIARRGVRG